MMSGFSAARKLDCRPDNFLFAVSNFLKNGVIGNFIYLRRLGPVAHKR